MATQSTQRTWRPRVRMLDSRAVRRTVVEWAKEPSWQSREWREAIRPLRGGYRSWLDYDSCREVRYIKVSRNFARSCGRHLHLMLNHELLHRGLVRSRDCRCSHCNADRDCCGNLIGGSVRITRIKGRTFRIEQNIYRNI